MRRHCGQEGVAESGIGEEVYIEKISTSPQEIEQGGNRSNKHSRKERSEKP
jgi:hypothetical protein